MTTTPQATTICRESGEPHAIYTDGSVCRCEVFAKSYRMTRAELVAWLWLRGDPDGQLAAEVDRYAGKTEDEMDAIYDAMHPQP